MSRKNTPPAAEAAETEQRVEETPWEALASSCSVLVIGLFIFTFLAQNFVIPSGSMEKTLLVGDHLVVDRLTLAPPSKWMPLERYREPQRGDIIVFLKPVADGTDADGNPIYNILVKRLVGVPGDHIHLRGGTVFINGVAQAFPHAQPTTAENYQSFLDEFPAIPASMMLGATDAWSVDMPSHVVDGDLVVPPGMYFMMGDNRHNSLDSRFWGLVPRQNIMGRPMFNYWSFKTPDAQYERTGIVSTVSWLGHVAVHFFSDTRWSRTFHVTR